MAESVFLKVLSTWRNFLSEKGRTLMITPSSTLCSFATALAANTDTAAAGDVPFSLHQDKRTSVFILSGMRYIMGPLPLSASSSGTRKRGTLLASFLSSSLSVSILVSNPSATSCGS